MLEFQAARRLLVRPTSPEAIIDRGIFEAFPDPPDDPSATGTRNLRHSLDTVKTRLMHARRKLRTALEGEVQCEISTD